MSFLRKLIEFNQSLGARFDPREVDEFLRSMDQASVNSDNVSDFFRSGGVPTIRRARIDQLETSNIDWFNLSTKTGNIDRFGDLSFGSDISAASTAGLHFFSVAQTYNGESMGAGDFMLGDNSSGKGNLLWDASAGTLYFRNGVIATNLIASGSLQANGCKLTRSTDQTISSSPSPQYVSFDTEAYDDNGFASLGGSPTKITIPANRAGRYEMGAYLVWEAAFAQTTAISINGTYNVAAFSTTSSFAISLYGEQQLAEGDYVELQVTQNTGSDHTVKTGTARPALWIRRSR